MNQRLNTHLATQLGISRREADSLIEHHHVRINDELATLGARFDDGDRITVKGKPLGDNVSFEYLALHKPIGYVSSRRKQGSGRPSMSLFPPTNTTSSQSVGSTAIVAASLFFQTTAIFTST